MKSGAEPRASLFCAGYGACLIASITDPSKRPRKKISSIDALQGLSRTAD